MSSALPKFDEAHYPDGVNSAFKTMSAGDLEVKFGGETGLFHNPETREIAKHVPEFTEVFNTKCGLSTLKGKNIVDVGFGTGILTEVLADLSGKEGAVYATEISPGFLELMAKKCEETHKMQNVKFVANSDKDIANVPSDFADFVLICDVYHHFEDPISVMTDIKRVLKEDGVVVLVDFVRDVNAHWSHPENPEWVLSHVRAGQEVFEAEIVSCGFAIAHEVKMPCLKENYCVVFTHDKKRKE